MPRKKTISSSVDGEPRKDKKQRLDVNQVFGDSDTDENEADRGGPPSISNNADSSFTDVLLKKMEPTIQPKERYQNYDFNRVSIDGHTCDELRAFYERLRTSAFKHVRRLTMESELRFVREYAILSRPKAKVIPSAYNRFAKEARLKLVKKRPELAKSLKAVIPMVAEQWRNLSPEKKRRYQEAYDKEREEYFREHPEFVKAKKRTKARSSKDKPSKVKPTKGPKSAFDLFCEAKNNEYASKYSLKGDGLKQKLAQKFAKLSDRKREKWENRAREAINEYIQQLSNKNGSHVENEFATSDGAPAADTQKTKKRKVRSSSDEAQAEYQNLLAGDVGNSPRSSKHTKESAKSLPNVSNSWLD